METRREFDNIYNSHVGKNRHWSSELKVLHKEYLTALAVCFGTHEYTRMRVTDFVTLDFPVARQQTVVHYAGLLLPCQIAFLS